MAIKKNTKASRAAKTAKKESVRVTQKPARKIVAVTEKMTKVEIINEIAAQADLTQVQVRSVFEELEVIIARHLKKRSIGEFSLAGLIKITKTKKPARKARKNVPNPFRPGELMDVVAKPATVAIKAKALKKLKDLAG